MGAGLRCPRPPGVPLRHAPIPRPKSLSQLDFFGRPDTAVGDLKTQCRVERDALSSVDDGKQLRQISSGPLGFPPLPRALILREPRQAAGPDMHTVTTQCRPWPLASCATRRRRLLRRLRGLPPSESRPTQTRSAPFVATSTTAEHLGAPLLSHSHGGLDQLLGGE